MNRILIVDDMPEVYSMLVGHFPQSDYAANTRQAIEYMDHREYSQVITDYHLGEEEPQGGLEVVREASSRGIECILMSRENHEVEALEAGAKQFIFKRELIKNGRESISPHEGRKQYFNEEFKKQSIRKNDYLKYLKKLRKLLNENEEEIKYNEGWIKFHQKSLEEHKKVIEETFDLDKKIDQEGKLKFHKDQIENHHLAYIGYHKKEILAIKEEIKLFEQGIKRCEEQVEFLNEKFNSQLL